MKLINLVKILFLAVSLQALPACGKSPEVWCFVGMLREFRCHPTPERCWGDWHQVWDQELEYHTQNPLPCMELKDWE